MRYPALVPIWWTVLVSFLRGSRPSQFLEHLFQVILSPPYLLGHISGFLEEKPFGKLGVGDIGEGVDQEGVFEFLPDGLHIILWDEVPLLLELEMDPIPHTVSEKLEDLRRDPVLRGLGKRHRNNDPETHIPSVSGHPAGLVPELKDQVVGQPSPFEKPSLHLTKKED